MEFLLTSCIIWYDDKGNTHCIKKYERTNGTLYCQYERIDSNVKMDEYKNIAPRGVVYESRDKMVRWNF